MAALAARVRGHDPSAISGGVSFAPSDPRVIAAPLDASGARVYDRDRAREPRHVIAPRRQLVVLRHPPRVRARDARERRGGHAVSAPHREPTDARAARHRHRAPSRRRYRSRAFSSRPERYDARARLDAARPSLRRTAHCCECWERLEVKRARAAVACHACGEAFPMGKTEPFPLLCDPKIAMTLTRDAAGGGDGARRQSGGRLFPLRARLEGDARVGRHETTRSRVWRRDTRRTMRSPGRSPSSRSRRERRSSSRALSKKANARVSENGDRGVRGNVRRACAYARGAFTGRTRGCHRFRGTSGRYRARGRRGVRRRDRRVPHRRFASKDARGGGEKARRGRLRGFDGQIRRRPRRLGHRRLGRRRRRRGRHRDRTGLRRFDG